MTKNEFLFRADRISNNPLDRLSDKNRQKVENGNIIFDTHVHLFDVTTVSIKYFVKRLFKDFIGIRSDEPIIKTIDPDFQYLNKSEKEVEEAPIFNKEHDEEEDWEQLEKEVEKVSGNVALVNDAVLIEAKFATRGFIDVVKARKLLSIKSFKGVYDFYLDQFALSQYEDFGFRNQDQFVTALMMDLETGWGVKSRKRFEEQIQEYKDLTDELPILPFFNCDPRRENLYELFLEAFPVTGKSFFGVKIYPGLGYSPADYRLAPIFELCERKNIPVLSHCGGESVTLDKNSTSIYRDEELIDITHNTRQEVARELNDPKEWRKVLVKFPKLKLSLAHFGGDTSWEEKMKNGNHDKIKEIISLMRDYKNVYTDFSYNLIDASTQTTYINELSVDITEGVKLKDRVLYGTDYWVVIPGGNLQTRQNDFLNALSIKNVLEHHVTKNPVKYLFDVV